MSSKAKGTKYEKYIEKLYGIKGLTVSKIQNDTIPNYAYFPVIFDKELFGKDRDEVMGKLAKENIFTRKYFYPLISDYECYRNIYDSLKTPVAKKISNNVLTLPMYADLSIEDVNRICDIILKR